MTIIEAIKSAGTLSNVDFIRHFHVYDEIVRGTIYGILKSHRQCSCGKIHPEDTWGLL